MVISASYTADSTTADLLSTIINSPKLRETDLKKRPQKFGLYHPRYKSFLMTDELVSFYSITQGDVLELKVDLVFYVFEMSRGCRHHSPLIWARVSIYQAFILHPFWTDSEQVCQTPWRVINYSKILMEVDSGADTKWNYYGIYLPSNTDRIGGWMDDYKMLHSYPLLSVDKIELRSRFRMFIFDLQVFSASQNFTRNFVNMYISDMITAGEVLRIITSTNCLDYPTSWYGVYLHDNEQIPDNTRKLRWVMTSSFGFVSNLVISLVVDIPIGNEVTPCQRVRRSPGDQSVRYYGVRVSLNTAETTNQNSLFRSRDWLSANQGSVFHVPLIFYVPVTCLLKTTNGDQLDLNLCLIKNKINTGSTIVMVFKNLLLYLSPRFMSPTSPMEKVTIGRGRIPRMKIFEDNKNELKVVKSLSDSDSTTPIPSPASTLSPAASGVTSPQSPRFSSLNGGDVTATEKGVNATEKGVTVAEKGVTVTEKGDVSATEKGVTATEESATENEEQVIVANGIPTVEQQNGLDGIVNGGGTPVVNGTVNGVSPPTHLEIPADGGEDEGEESDRELSPLSPVIGR
eukprot:sb/3463444/